MSVSFKDFPLESLYNEFNKNIEDIGSDYCGIFMREDNKFPGIYTFCKKLVRNLRNILSNKLQNNLVTNPCSYLNYWMSKEVFNIVSHNSVQYQIFISMLLFPWRNTYTELSNIVENCSNPSDIFYSLTDISKFNNIINYVHNFKFLEEKIIPIIPEEKESYCNYIHSFFEKYDEYIRICNADKYENCYKLPKHPSEYNPQNFYNKLQCNKLNEPNAEPPAVPILDDTDGNPKDGESSENNSFHILPIFSSLIGALLVPLLTYKLTPVGSFLNKRIFNKRTQENIYGEMNNIDLEDISEGVNMNLDNEPFHITYQQV
ncbi:PIR Superfamily Protein [Plasmodium ovale wallikeri]|uniref:PIR protein n=2 Tax=Plasmodium ovale TaxID=36330 RepID=A0A1C3KI18_PLAOA|nr:PIR Superfamily Protein [Plasmodium ovale wallikeri]SBT57051.1 PIR Superfamily Protein [Plasmodium ovale wallikeri]SBT73459.1 PIR protein [Plasmodium ovale]SBT74059.1 PIR protein [Plasmodium ovale]